jgi:hypothetical protein
MNEVVAGRDRGDLDFEQFHVHFERLFDADPRQVDITVHHI